jgi:lipoprotein-anchoring transpeptidase ErfK/SrfK
MPSKWTRRQVLRLIAATAATAALAPALHARAQYPITPPEDEESSDIFELWGRAIHTVSIYEEPSVRAARTKVFYRDQSFRIFGETRAPFSRHNDLWYRTAWGYAHSAWVLPVRLYPPQPFISEVGEWGFWGEVAQIYTDARHAPHVNSGRAIPRVYGGCVFRVLDAVQDETGTGWYKIADDYPPGVIGKHQWALAKDIRRISRREMAPIHPFVGKKRIEVSLGEQTLSCYEGDELVYSTLVAAGRGGESATPAGQKYVLLKQPSRHMSNVPYEGGPEPFGGIFDLPGVPWNTFFDMEGAAIHGAYWHNDFGIPRSHGCLNVPIAAARFIYRWVHPIGGYQDDFIRSSPRVGTPILVE